MTIHGKTQEGTGRRRNLGEKESLSHGSRGFRAFRGFYWGSELR